MDRGSGKKVRKSNELPGTKREYILKTTAITQQLGMKATSSGTNYTFLNEEFTLILNKGPNPPPLYT